MLNTVKNKLASCCSSAKNCMQSLYNAPKKASKTTKIALGLFALGAIGLTTAHYGLPTSLKEFVNPTKGNFLSEYFNPTPTLLQRITSIPSNVKEYFFPTQTTTQKVLEFAKNLPIPLGY